MWQTVLLLRRRARYHWQMVITLSLGVILATALMASGPILIDNVLALALQQTLRNAPALEANLLLTERLLPNQAAYDALDREVRELVPQHFPASYSSLQPTGSMRPVFPWLDGRFVTDQRLVVSFYGESDAQFIDKVNFVTGGWPAPYQPSDEAIGVVIGQPLAQAYRLGVGDRLAVSQESDALSPDLAFEIAGIVQASDLQDPFWFKAFSPLRAQDDGRFREYSLILPRESFFTVAEIHFAELNVDYAWQLQIDEAALSLIEATSLPFRVENLSIVAGETESRISVTTDLPETIADFVVQATAVRGPLYFLVMTVVLLALYYVTMVASLGLLRLRHEFVLLRSRGASPYQLFNFQLLEGAFISGVAILSGPILARWLVQGLTVFGPLAQINSTDWALTIPQVAWLAAVVGAFACLGSLLWPVPATVRQTAVQSLQSEARVARLGWWQRYYLDVVLLMVGIVLLWRFAALGGLVNDAAGVGQTDWVIILAPVALLFGSATILLRLFPILLVWAAKAASRRPGLTTTLTLWQTARDPRHVTRLVLLLTLTIALGIFATSLRAALTLNEEARARYAVGGDVRLLNVNVDEETAVIDNLEGATSVAWRGRASFDSAIDGRFPSLSLLAINPDTFSEVVTYRDDFAEQPVPDLLTALVQFNEENAFPRGYALPDQTEALGLWLRLPVEEDDALAWEGINFDAKLIDGDGRYHLLPLEFGDRIDGQYRYFEGATADLPQPLRLGSIWLRSRTFSPELRQLLAYDDLTAVTPAGEQLLEGFEGEQEWAAVSFSFLSLISQFEPRSGEGRLELGFARRGMDPRNWYGLQYFADFRRFPMPALVSSDFLEASGLRVGDEVGIRVQPNAISAHVFTFHIIGAVDYFPTLYDEEDEGFIITLRDPLLTELNVVLHETVRPNELLLTQTDAAVRSPELFGQASQVFELETVWATLRALPMAVGLRSAALFGYILATVLTLAGFSSNFILSTRQRVGQFTVLRALGLSSQQMYRLLLLEQLLLIISGLLLGTLLGVMLTLLTLNNLNFNWGNLASAPPFLATFDWTAVLRVYLLLGTIFMLALMLATAVLRRVDIYRSLRIGED